MAICEIHSYAVPDSFAGGVGRAVTWCKTHDLQVVTPMTHRLCPLGRIEQAMEALARIQALAIEVLHAKQD